MADDSYLDNPLFWLRRASLVMHRSVDEALSEQKLTTAQFEVLRRLRMQDGLAHGALQEYLGITGPTLNGIVQGLVERHLIERQVSDMDARVRLLYLTPQGIAMDEMICSAVQAAHTRLLDGFTRSEIALLRDWLQRIVANAGDTSDSCH